MSLFFRHLYVHYYHYKCYNISMILADISNIKQQDKADSLLSNSVALLLEKEEAIDELTRVIELKSGVISEQKKRASFISRFTLFNKSAMKSGIN